MANVGAAILSPAVCISDVMKKVVMSGKVSNTSRANLFNSLAKSESVWLPEEIKFEEGKKKRLLWHECGQKNIRSCKWKYFHIFNICGQLPPSLRVPFKRCRIV